MFFSEYREPDESVWSSAAAAALNSRNPDKKLKPSDVKIKSVSLEDGAKKGDNFTSVIKRANVEVEGEGALRFVVKLPPVKSRITRWWESMALFEREAVFYSKMLPEMRECFNGEEVGGTQGSSFLMYAVRFLMLLHYLLLLLLLVLLL